MESRMAERRRWDDRKPNNNIKQSWGRRKHTITMEGDINKVTKEVDQKKKFMKTREVFS